VESRRTPLRPHLLLLLTRAFITAMPTTTRPAQSEYGTYYERYVSQVPDGDILATLEQQLGETVHLLGGVTESQGDYRYAPGKWSVKEVVGHLVDTERVFAYRTLAFARGDTTPLPSFEQDDYVAGGNFGRRTLKDLCGEFVHVRRGNLHLFRGFDDEVLGRQGTASGKSFTVRAMLWIVAGHERHHARGLREKYLTQG
jgi:hypothetical protein